MAEAGERLVINGAVPENVPILLFEESNASMPENTEVGLVLPAFVTLDTLKLNEEPAGKGEELKVKVTLSWLAAGCVHVTLLSMVPTEHAEVIETDTSAGKVM